MIRFWAFVFLFSCLFKFAHSGINEAIYENILPGYESFAEKTSKLHAAARKSCEGIEVKEAFHHSFDTWLSIHHIQFGPVEKNNLLFSLYFWPDPKDRTQKSLRKLSTERDEIVNNPVEFRSVSVAAKGLMSIERLLYDKTFLPTSYKCKLIRAITFELQKNASKLRLEWFVLANNIYNSRYEEISYFESSEDVKRAIFSSIITGLEFNEKHRLGRPLGTFERPRPKRAETRRSNRSIKNISLSLISIESLFVSFTDNDFSKVGEAFKTSIIESKALKEGDFKQLSDPQVRFKLEKFKGSIMSLSDLIVDDVGRKLKIRTGFNAFDGD